MLLSIIVIALLSQSQPVDPTLPPRDAHVLFTAEAHGVQIYQCDTHDGAFAWTYQAPEADLFDPATHQPVGTHSAGPTWTWADGSSISGKVVQKQPAPDPAAIPWLLVETHPANETKGALSAVTLVRRSQTQAGSAPATGCDAQHQGNMLRVPYAAVYTFYSTKP